MGKFALFYSCDLDQVTFIYELDPYPLKIYRIFPYIKVFKVTTITYRHTDRPTDAT